MKKLFIATLLLAFGTVTLYAENNVSVKNHENTETNSTVKAKQIMTVTKLHPSQRSWKKK